MAAITFRDTHTQTTPPPTQTMTATADKPMPQRLYEASDQEGCYFKSLNACGLTPDQAAERDENQKKFRVEKNCPSYCRVGFQQRVLNCVGTPLKQAIAAVAVITTCATGILAIIGAATYCACNLVCSLPASRSASTPGESDGLECLEDRAADCCEVGTKLGVLGGLSATSCVYKTVMCPLEIICPEVRESVGIPNTQLKLIKSMNTVAKNPEDKPKNPEKNLRAFPLLLPEKCLSLTTNSV